MKVLDLNIFLVKYIHIRHLQNNAKNVQHLDDLKIYVFLFKKLIFI